MSIRPPEWAYRNDQVKMPPVEMVRYKHRGSHLELKLIQSPRKIPRREQDPGLECQKAGGRWDLYKGSDLSNIRIKGNSWMQRRSVLKGRLGVFYIPPVLTVIQGSSVVSTVTEHILLDIEHPKVQTRALEVWMGYRRLLTFGRRTKGTCSRAYPCTYSRIRMWFCVY
ncbi:hypothetical protein EV421DRAFT_1745089 [Armillaria borealis]|uniref:Uncharacterized protein n=1 Tax=Armillaria borealis TaxID=47425 RepID=A0AA39IVM9_9AGAR|nr:hypothetical protein EV421DRAFT_1745089 [Armillaria borealis]